MCSLRITTAFLILVLETFFLKRSKYPFFQLRSFDTHILSVLWYDKKILFLFLENLGVRTIYCGYCSATLRISLNGRHDICSWRGQLLPVGQWNSRKSYVTSPIKQYIYSVLVSFAWPGNYFANKLEVSVETRCKVIWVLTFFGTFNNNKTPELLPSTIRLIPVFNFLPSVENVTVI